MSVVPVILSGGMGVRLWPLSREARPKQFLNLTGADSLIVSTAKRFAYSNYAPPVVIAHRDHRFIVAEQLREADIAVDSILLEPEARNTAAAIASAAAHVASSDPDAVMLVAPSDHVIANKGALHSAVACGVPAAKAGCAVTFGVNPTSPHSGYGYIEIADQLPDLPGVHSIARFVEKPSADVAEKIYNTGQYFWNSGMFLISAETALEMLETAVPGFRARAESAVSSAKKDLDFLRLDQAAYSEVPRDSFDRVVMEKTDRGAVVPVDMDWSDIGSWDALWAHLPKDSQGNASAGDVIAEDARDCVVHSDDQLVALMGVENLVVVASDDGVLVMPRERSQELRTLVDKLCASGREEVATSRTGYRPWGHYRNIDVGEGFKVKRIVVRPGGQLSLQRHQRRAEHWVVVQGIATIERGEESLQLHPNQSIYIPVGTNHRLANEGAEELLLIEVQTGDYLGEDDIERLDDVYGRVEE
jgi:mannose-1-phosphate guanylyltransferase/mannose-6-phosphate isomerase